MATRTRFNSTRAARPEHDRRRLGLDVVRGQAARFPAGQHQMKCHHVAAVGSTVLRMIVDSETVRCDPGSLLVLRPGQEICTPSNHRGVAWCVRFCADFVTPLGMSAIPENTQVGMALKALPTHLRLDPTQRETVNQCVVLLERDLSRFGRSLAFQSLLRLQLYSLLLRLRVTDGAPEPDRTASGTRMHLFKRLERLLERRYKSMHQVAACARELGCSEKSLNRSTLDALGINAKEFIASRINFEAKRLLAETAQPLTRVADQLGFNEVSNFARFFKREVGMTPAQFRRRRSEAAG